MTLILIIIKCVHLAKHFPSHLLYNSRHLYYIIEIGWVCMYLSSHCNQLESWVMCWYFTILWKKLVFELLNICTAVKANICIELSEGGDKIVPSLSPCLFYAHCEYYNCIFTCINNIMEHYRIIPLTWCV